MKSLLWLMLLATMQNVSGIQPSWSFETVAGGASPNMEGAPIAFAMEKTGAPHVAYTAAFELPHSYYYGTKKQGSWQTTEFDTYPLRYGTFEAGLDIAIDSKGCSHMCYTKDYANKTNQWGVLFYAKQDAPGANTFTIMAVNKNDTLDDVDYCSLALDSNDLPHIAYYAGSPTRTPRYAYQDSSGAWTTAQIDSGWEGYFIKLRLDSAGRAHVVYFSEDGFVVRYSYLNGTMWRHNQLPAKPPVGYGLSFVLDDKDIPHLTFTNNTFNNSLYYAKGSMYGVTWTIETIGDATRASMTALAIDNKGNPHVVYDYSTNDQDPADHRYAWKDEDSASWQTCFVHKYAMGHQIQLDTNQKPYILLGVRPDMYDASVVYATPTF
eukprot:m.324053 g.324053  ORF g.324053 m.324053 type:complete len:379 (-) comp16540_c9_seq1:113-1249(-)